VQIAKARGAYVIGTASAANHDLVRSLGADELVDYHVADFAEVVTGADVVLDTVSGDYPARSLRTLRPGGVLICLRPFPADVATEAARRDIRAEAMLVEADHSGMTAIADLVTQGELRPVIAGTFPPGRRGQGSRTRRQGARRRKAGLDHELTTGLAPGAATGKRLPGWIVLPGGERRAELRLGAHGFCAVRVGHPRTDCSFGRGLDAPHVGEQGRPAGGCGVIADQGPW
jgi:hypothetical protein